MENMAIATQKLTKTYAGNRGITELDLEIKEGEVFGFLGPNGAGKTTTIRILLDLIRPTSGHALVLGLDSTKDSVQIKRHIGYLPGEFSLYPNLTGAKTLQYFANLRGGVDWTYIRQLTERLELDLTKKFRQYSRGNKQKLGIVQALMHKPRLLILDEPTSGLDPLNQQEFYRLITEARNAGTTIFFSSHIISEVEKTCDRVGIIRDGKLIKIGNIESLTGIKTHQIELTFAQNVPLEDFEKIAGVTKLERGENNVVRCVATAESLDAIIKTAARYSVVNLAMHEPSLEDIFLNYYRETK